MKKSKGIVVLLLTLILTVFFCFTAAVGIGPTGTGAAKHINTGLDLAGGVSITYQAKDKNPSAEDIVQAIRDVNAKHAIILPNNSNIVMTAQQAAIILEDEIDVQVIPSKTIPQGLSACIMYNPEVSLTENLAEMNDAIANVKTGQVTFAIKDTNIDGVDIKANQYMALCEKEITACVPSKIDALKETLNGLVDEDSEIITLIYGEDVTAEEVAEAETYVEEHFDAELECVDGKQPVYSFILGVE